MCYRKLSQEEIDHIQQEINANDDGFYTRTCAIISKDRDQFIQLKDKYLQLGLIVRYEKDSFCLENGEHWHYFKTRNGQLLSTVRGYRFQKLKIDRDINAQCFYYDIFPRCIFCKEIEFI